MKRARENFSSFFDVVATSSTRSGSARVTGRTRKRKREKDFATKAQHGTDESRGDCERGREKKKEKICRANSRAR